MSAASATASGLSMICTPKVVAQLRRELVRPGYTTAQNPSTRRESATMRAPGTCSGSPGLLKHLLNATTCDGVESDQSDLHIRH
jgi:hypothetical protein